MFDQLVTTQAIEGITLITKDGVFYLMIEVTYNDTKMISDLEEIINTLEDYGIDEDILNSEIIYAYDDHRVYFMSA